MPTWLLIIVINGVILGLLGYIWRSMEKRVGSMEDDNKEETKSLKENPVLTTHAHNIQCDKRQSENEKFISVQMGQIVEKLEGVEKRTALLIENAILKTIKNGNKRSKR